MRKTVFGAVATLALVMGVAGAVRAGARRSGTVSINTTSRVARGYLASIRSSSNSVEYLDCYRYAYWTGYSDLWCTARDASGTTVTCSTETPELVQAAAGINGDSYVAFYWDSTGECTEIDVDEGSYTPAK